ncbi:MAG: thioredoxin domain-containing protein, partial [Bacteroidetes bacterium]
NKMLIISIGYAACHWCHVMEEESFMDTAVARLMNEHFVSIKVDREERPDIDDIYMTACQIATGRGCGWPLNAFALPDGRPVWAGTYFPKKEWLKVLKYFIDLYQKEPDKLNTYAAQLADGIQGVGTITPNEGEPEFTRATLDDLADKFLQEIDFRWGGRKGAPKFPIPNKYQFLLRYHHLSGNPRALEAVTVTLDRMADGGIYDQLGGGFARYATDDQWVVPHFEKMLYDNGQLVSLYAQAWQVTQNPRYRTIVEETLAFVKRELASPEGGFYSSLDADSEGEEGKFYVWTKAEIDSILGGGDLSSMFCDYFEVSRSGNWEDGKNILHRRKPLEEVARTFNLSPEDCLAQINQARQKLFEARAQRPRPRTDDKVLTAWNALMLQGYVDAFKAFGVEAYRERALRTGRFLLQNMLHEDNRLDRNFKDGKSSINAFLDDYALTIQAFIGLYEITFDESWLQKARDLTEYVLEHFDDP